MEEKKKKRVTQTKRVLDYVKAHGSITQREADKISVSRLASRINDIKKTHLVESWFEDGVNQYGEPVRYKRYRIDAEANIQGGA